MKKEMRFNVRFASKEEGQQLILGNTQYYNRLTQVDIDWRQEGKCYARRTDFVRSVTGVRLHPERDRSCHGSNSFH